jgi:glycosyltransferase involved in cell wall biosynthesis
MKKIAIVYQGAKYYGGIESYIEQLFLNIDRKNIELTLISLGEWELTKRLQTKKFKVIVVPINWYQLYKSRELTKLYLENEFDLIVSQGMVSNFYARLSASKAGIPNLVTIHSDYKYDFHGVKKSIFAWSFRLLEAKTKKYIVVSKYLSNETQELGASIDKIRIVYNGVKELPSKPKKRSKELIIGSLGRLHYKKGYHNLIQAAGLLADEKFKVYIWGEGEEKIHLDALIKQNHLVGKVILKGFAKDVTKALAETDIYIQPSLEEGFGITVAEAMYAEKPIIVSPAGSLPELITDGKTGLIAKGTNPAAIAAAIKTLLDNKELDRKLGKEARAEALKRFSLDKWVKETEKVYLETSK